MITIVSTKIVNNSLLVRYEGVVSGCTFAPSYLKTSDDILMWLMKSLDVSAPELIEDFATLSWAELRPRFNMKWCSGPELNHVMDLAKIAHKYGDTYNTHRFYMELSNLTKVSNGHAMRDALMASHGFHAVQVMASINWVNEATSVEIHELDERDYSVTFFGSCIHQEQITDLTKACEVAQGHISSQGFTHMSVADYLRSSGDNQRNLQRIIVSKEIDTWEGLLEHMRCRIHSDTMEEVITLFEGYLQELSELVSSDEDLGLRDPFNEWCQLKRASNIMHGFASW